jgi:hypothetical protein
MLYWGWLLLLLLLTLLLHVPHRWLERRGSRRRRRVRQRLWLDDQVERVRGSRVHLLHGTNNPQIYIFRQQAHSKEQQWADMGLSMQRG